MAPTQLLTHARRIAFGGTSGLAGLTAYKSQTDPVHIFWDLDHTILCSITPLPAANIEGPNSSRNASKCPVSLENILPSPTSLQHFDQIDDDFDYEDSTPNTRTFFRPGAQVAIRLCSYFGVLHVYTAAQETYTNNILAELDPDKSLFGPRVIHRCGFPEIVKQGKDLTVGTDNVHRAILFDDKVSNFKPQNDENGVAVVPFTADKVAQCHSGSWGAYVEELKEMSRLVGIAIWSTVHFSGDARKVVGWVRSWKNRDEQ